MNKKEMRVLTTIIVMCREFCKKELIDMYRFDIIERAEFQSAMDRIGYSEEFIERWIDQ